MPAISCCYVSFLTAGNRSYLRYWFTPVNAVTTEMLPLTNPIVACSAASCSLQIHFLVLYYSPHSPCMGCFDSKVVFCHHTQKQYLLQNKVLCFLFLVFIILWKSGPGILFTLTTILSPSNPILWSVSTTGPECRMHHSPIFNTGVEAVPE